MDDLNRYMNNVSTISSLRERVQNLVNLKEEYLSLEKVVILSAVEMEDNKRVTDAYKNSIDRNDTLLDLIMEIKNEIFKIKLIKESLDRNTQAGLSQIKIVDNLINILRDILDILNDERSKLDRVVRYYEKSFSYYNNF